MGDAHDIGVNRHADVVAVQRESHTGRRQLHRLHLAGIIDGRERIAARRIRPRIQQVDRTPVGIRRRARRRRDRGDGVAVRRVEHVVTVLPEFRRVVEATDRRANALHIVARRIPDNAESRGELVQTIRRIRAVGWKSRIAREHEPCRRVRKHGAVQTLVEIFAHKGHVEMVLIFGCEEWLPAQTIVEGKVSVRAPHVLRIEADVLLLLSDDLAPALAEYRWQPEHEVGHRHL